MKDFFAMGGYAFYIWTSYGLALIILAINLVSPLLQRRKLLADIARKRRRDRRPQAAGRPAVEQQSASDINA